MKPEDITVLVIEDDEPLRLSLISDLNELGYLTVPAPDGFAALEVLRFNRVDIVLSDLRMPNLNGVQVLKAMRSSGHFQPFVMLSGFGSREEITELLRLGAFDFLEKPVDFGRLSEVLAEAATLTLAQDKIKEEFIKTSGISDSELTPKLEQAIRQITRLSASRVVAKKKA